MAEIRIDRLPTLQKGKPDSVYLKLYGDDGILKAFVAVFPKFEKPPFTDTFRVEIHKGGMISPDVDIRVNI